MIKACLLALVLAVSLASAAVVLIEADATDPGATGGALADPFKDGKAAYNKDDYATALKLYRPLADRGNAKAQFSLGVMYYSGQGVPEDYAQAVIWYRKAADQGNADAQYNLGLMYYSGLGVPEDDAQAVSWYRKAADQGIANAQLNLGVMYADGHGVPQDYIQAHMWWSLAATELPGVMDSAVVKAVSNRDRVATMMTPAQIAEAQRLASAWKPKL